MDAIDWDLDDDGRIKLPQLSGFAIAVLSKDLLGVQLRIETGDSDRNAERFQIGMSAAGTRQFALALLEAADLMEEEFPPGRLN